MTAFQPPEDTHRWLQDRDSVSVGQFIKHENRLTQYAMRQLYSLTDVITQEIVEQLDMSPGQPHKHILYC